VLQRIELETSCSRACSAATTARRYS
jgi:hypothetical protein